MMRMSNHIEGTTFAQINHSICHRFISESHEVHSGTWQGVDVSKRPEANMRELMNVTFTLRLKADWDLLTYQRNIKPNLPWADHHFMERVCGWPINPGIEWANWPWGDNAAKFLEPSGMFNHNYMERLWPVHAGHSLKASRNAGEFMEGMKQYHSLDVDKGPNYGIRGRFGDLFDMINLMVRDPLTRQAWVPLFFPEDTGDANPGRKPCTLGYQFMMREEKLHIYYPLRSCDFAKHFRDDAYLAVRLGMWVLERLRYQSPFWEGVELGSLSMHCTSLHMFINDFHKMRSDMA